jgi:hypothetical protein
MMDSMDKMPLQPAKNALLMGIAALPGACVLEVILSVAGLLSAITVPVAIFAAAALSIVGFLSALKAFKLLKAEPETYTGRGQAIAGLVLCILGGIIHIPLALLVLVSVLGFASLGALSSMF